MLAGVQAPVRGIVEALGLAVTVLFNSKFADVVALPSLSLVRGGRTALLVNASDAALAAALQTQTQVPKPNRATHTHWLLSFRGLACASLVFAFYPSREEPPCSEPTPTPSPRTGSSLSGMEWWPQWVPRRLSLDLARPPLRLCPLVGPPRCPCLPTTSLMRPLTSPSMRRVRSHSQSARRRCVTARYSTLGHLTYYSFGNICSIVTVVQFEHHISCMKFLFILFIGTQQ